MDVGTAVEMEKAMQAACGTADLVFMAAAVADYRPARRATGKIQRSSATMTLELEPNPDVLAGLGARRRKNQVLVGFALEISGGVNCFESISTFTSSSAPPTIL